MKSMSVERISLPSEILGMDVGKSRKGAAAPWGVIGAFVGVAVVALLAGSYLTGGSIKSTCMKAFNGNTICAIAPYAAASGQQAAYIDQTTGQLLDKYQQPITSGTPTLAPSNGASPTPIPSASQIGIDSLSVKVKDPKSNAYTTWAGAMDFYTAGVNFKASNVYALQTVTIAAGNATAVAMTGINAGTPYTLILNGGGTYYDSVIPSFTFDAAKYNAVSSIYNMGTLIGGARIGAPALTLSNTTSYTGIVFNGYSLDGGATQVTETRTIGYNATAVGGTSGQFTARFLLSNPTANSEVKSEIMQSQLDSAAPAAGNEFATATLQEVSGTPLFSNANAGLSNDLAPALSSLSTTSLGTINGGVSSTFDIAFTITNANVHNATSSYVYFDDLGGYLAKDQLPANSGAAPLAIRFRWFK